MSQPCSVWCVCASGAILSDDRRVCSLDDTSTRVAAVYAALSCRQRGLSWITSNRARSAGCTALQPSESCDDFAVLHATDAAANVESAGSTSDSGLESSAVSGCSATGDFADVANVCY